MQCCETLFLKKLQVNGTWEPEVGSDPIVRRLPPDIKNTQDQSGLGSAHNDGEASALTLRALSSRSSLSLSICNMEAGTETAFHRVNHQGHGQWPQSLASVTACPYFSNYLKKKNKKNNLV